MDTTNSSKMSVLLSQLERDTDTGAWIWDLGSGQVSMTEKAFTNLGFEPEDSLGMQEFLQPFGSDNQKLLLEKLNLCLSGSAFKQEFDIYAGKARLRKIEISAKPFVSENSVTGVIGSLRDRTDSWLQLARYQLAIEAGDVGVWEYHWPTDTLHWNPSMFDFYGIDTDVSLNLSHWEQALHPEDKRSAIEAFKSSVQKCQNFSFQFRIKTPTHDVKHIKAVAQTFYDEMGVPVNSIGVNIDITRLKNQEEALMVEKTVSLQHAKLAAIGELAAGIGHEINNPLAIDIGTVSMLEELLYQKGVLDKDICALLERHKQSTLRIKSIVMGMRRLVRDDSNTDKQEVNVSELVQNLINLVGEIYKKEGINLHADLVEGLCVKGHFGELQQALMNLLSNAKDAVKDFDSKIISIRVCLANDEYVRIEVADNGIGIPCQVQQRVFDNFFSTKASDSGSGIGLGIVRRIVSEHDGKVTFESEVGCGSTFVIELPRFETLVKYSAESAFSNLVSTLSKPTEAPEKQLDEPVHSEIKFKTAVVIDDEPMLLQVLESYLESMGVSCFVTTEPRLALKKLATGQFDLLMTDMCMPEMDGLTLIRQTKALGIQNLKCIVMTGGITKDLSNKEHEELESAADVIYKPFSHDDIRSLLIQSESASC